MNLCLDFLPFDLAYFRCTLCSDAYFYLVYSCCSWAPFFCFLARFEGVDFFVLKVICSVFFFFSCCCIGNHWSIGFRIICEKLVMYVLLRYPVTVKVCLYIKYVLINLLVV